VLIAVTIFPTIYTIYLSVTEYKSYVLTHQFVGAKNYLDLMNQANFYNSLHVSALYVVLTVAASIFFGFVLALALNQNLRATSIFRAIVILPFTIAPIITGFTWRYLFDSNQGLVGAFILPLLGLNFGSILGNPTNAFMAIVFADVWSKTPLMFLIILGGLQGISPTLYKAAKIDGASVTSSFTHVTLPLMKRALIIAVILKVIDSVNSFDQVYVMTRGGPGNATQVLAIEGYLIAFSNYNIGMAAALGVVMIVISVISISILIGYYNKT
jgi:multiple sugar transport system permease protein